MTSPRAGFQASKFFGRPDIAEHIRHIRSPHDAQEQANRLARLRRPDWFEVNVAIMDTILYVKFTQHEALRQLLLSTGNREIVHSSPVSLPCASHRWRWRILTAHPSHAFATGKFDAFWGIGPDGTGRNELGKALVRLREKLRFNQGLDCDHQRAHANAHKREHEQGIGLLPLQLMLDKYR